MVASRQKIMPIKVGSLNHPLPVHPPLTLTVNKQYKTYVQNTIKILDNYMIIQKTQISKYFVTLVTKSKAIHMWYYMIFLITPDCKFDVTMITFSCTIHTTSISHLYVTLVIWVHYISTWHMTNDIYRCGYCVIIKSHQ